MLVWKKTLTMILLLTGIGIVVYYRTCGQSCTFLKGTFLGIDLTYLGIAFCSLLMVLSLLGIDLLNTVLLSMAMGTEAYLIGFQVKSGVYCPYCLMFAAVIVALFAIHFRGSSKLLVTSSFLFGFLLFFLLFRGATVPLLGYTPLPLPSFTQQASLYPSHLLHNRQAL